MEPSHSQNTTQIQPRSIMVWGFVAGMVTCLLVGVIVFLVYYLIKIESKLDEIDNRKQNNTNTVAQGYPQPYPPVYQAPQQQPVSPSVVVPQQPQPVAPKAESNVPVPQAPVAEKATAQNQRAEAAPAKTGRDNSSFLPLPNTAPLVVGGASEKADAAIDSFPQKKPENIESKETYVAKSSVKDRGEADFSPLAAKQPAASSGNRTEKTLAANQKTASNFPRPTPTNVVITAPEGPYGREGCITVMNAESSNRVVINLGANDDISKNDTFVMSRNGKTTGTLQARDVFADMTVCEITGDFGAGIRANDTVKQVLGKGERYNGKFNVVDELIIK